MVSGLSSFAGKSEPEIFCLVDKNALPLWQTLTASSVTLYFSFLVTLLLPPLSPTQSALLLSVQGLFDLFPRFLGKTQSLSPGHFWHIRSHMYTWHFVTIMTNVHLGKNWQGVLGDGEGDVTFLWMIRRQRMDAVASVIFIDFSTLKYFWKVQVWAHAKLSFVNKLSVINGGTGDFFFEMSREYDPIFIYAQDLSSKNKRSC